MLKVADDPAKFRRLKQEGRPAAGPSVWLSSRALARIPSCTCCAHSLLGKSTTVPSGHRKSLFHISTTQALLDTFLL